MRISELADRTGLPPSTLRFYEAEGLLPAEREANGYRRYGQAAVDRLAFISQAKTLDLSLADIRELVTAWESQPCSGVRAVYRPTLMDRATEVDRQMATMSALRRTLTQAIARLDDLPDREEPCDAGCTFLNADTAAEPRRIVCTLNGGSDYAERIAAWHQLLARADPVPDGNTVTLTLPIDQLEHTAALAAAEQRCCAFFDFQLNLHGPTFDLIITAPAEARGMLTDLVPPTGSGTA